MGSPAGLKRSHPSSRSHLPTRAALPLGIPCFDVAAPPFSSQLQLSMGYSRRKVQGAHARVSVETLNPNRVYFGRVAGPQATRARIVGCVGVSPTPHARDNSTPVVNTLNPKLKGGPLAPKRAGPTARPIVQIAARRTTERERLSSTAHQQRSLLVPPLPLCVSTKSITP